MSKLLLVEDDNNLREIYEARLQAEGYVIVSAKDGEEALVVAKAEKPDLIISDVMMPKISGFEMLDILRNTDELKNVKIIMLTALGQSDDQQRADRLGADRYLVKSQVTLEDIVKVAHELLQDETKAPAEPPVSAASAPVTATAKPAPATPPTSTPAPATPVAVAPEPVAEPPAVAVSTSEPKTEPVAVESVTPVPEPEAPPAEEPAPPTPVTADPVPILEPVSTPATPSDDSVAQSTAQEEADVEAKIEDFVADASSEPTRPAPAGTPETTDSDSVLTPDTTSPASDAAADDVLIAGAVQGLTATAPSIPQTVTPQPPEPQPTTATDPVASAPAITPAPTAEFKPEPAPLGAAPAVNKKIIKPLDTPPKKDIKTLLAMEEIAEKAVQGPPPPTAIITTDTTGPQAVPLSAPSAPAPATGTTSVSPATQPAAAVPAPDADDPNNIAL